MNKKMKSEQQHTIPRWLLENFTDSDGMLHVGSKDPRKFFKSKPRNVFRRRDYYAAKEIGESLESQLAKMENLALTHVKNVLRAAREGIEQGELSCVNAISDDIRACGLFLLHLAYRSPQWMGGNFFSGLDAIQVELERVGEDMVSAFQEENRKFIHESEFVLVLCQVDAPTLILGDCGPFVSQDNELGVDNQMKKEKDPNWLPTEQRMWMALSPSVALGVAMREAEAKVCVNLIPNSKTNVDWVDHFNEICARQSRMIAGPSEEWVFAASHKAWPMD